MKKILLAAIIFISSCTIAYSQCAKPTVVSITSPATISVCEGTAFTLYGTATVPGISQNGGFTYSWKKVLPTPVTVFIPPTAISMAANTTTTIAGFINNSAVQADAGTYVLRIEDGNIGNPTCYTEASIVVTVNPKPAITSVLTGMTCSGVAQNYFITSNVASTYTWTRAVITGISNTAVTAQTANPITETLTNTTSIPIVVRYFITATSTTSCDSPAFFYDVTVHPKPNINSPAIGAVWCGAAQNYSITSIPLSTYTWTRAAVTGIINAIGSGTENQITETLTNTTTSPVTAQYIITPTSTKGCTGTPFHYDVTVYNSNSAPTPSVSITANPGSTICNGTSVTFKAYPVFGGISPTYEWSSSVNGLTSATGDTYTSSNLVDGEVISVKMNSTFSCASPISASNSITMDVWAAGIMPSISLTADKTNICANHPVTFYAAATNVILRPSYEWFIEVNGNQISQGAPSVTSFFTTPSLQSNTTILVKITSNDACANPAPVSSTPLTIFVYSPISAGTISAQTICAGTIPQPIQELTASKALSPTYTWISSNGSNVPVWSIVSDANSPNLILSDIYNFNGQFRRIVTDVNLPAPCNIAYSDPVTITVVPCTSFSSFITGPSQITPGQQNVAYSVPNQTGFTYAWSITGGTITSGQNTNSVTVDWDNIVSSPTARTTSASYSISVTETNQTNQTHTTTLDLTTITTGTTLSQAQSGINVFPNPTTGSFNIEMPESGVDVTYEILDVTGLSITSGTFTSTGNDQQIDADLCAGLYQVILKYNNVVTCVRLSKIQ